MSRLRRFVACLCLLACASVAQAQKPPTDTLRQEIETARQKVYPALVNITVVMRYYAKGRSQRTPGGGSGVIVSKDGYVLTNFHVAGHTTRITCTLPSGEAMEARVVLHDPLTDLSVLKLRLDKRADPNAPLPFAALGDSDALQVGDHVLAMGNPMMLASSMTLGIVSNTKRVFTDFTATQIEDQELDEGEQTGIFTRWIQHDALILPGNSGGPLVNLKGEVVGINELGGGGVGFAIPSNIAAQVLKASLSSNEVKRSWLGLSVLPVSKLERATGALVSAVVPGSPAEKAGVAPGDILLTLDGEPVAVRFFEEIPLLYQRIALLPTGKQITLTCLRNGETRTATATLTPMEKYVGKEEEYREAGITVQEITAPMALINQFPTKNGVLVTGVRPGFPFEAAKPAIGEGDVILAVGDTPISDLAAFRKVMAGVEKKEVAVTFRRNFEEMITVVQPVPDKPSEVGGELPKAWLGVKTQVLTPEIAQAMKLPNTKGFRITQVYPETEAGKAGLHLGDVITALNGDKLNAFRPQDAEDLKHLVEDLPIGKPAQLAIVRDGKPQKLAVVMEAAPTDSSQAKKATQKEFEFTVRELMPMDRMERKWAKNQKGLLVVEITQGGWAQMSGLDADDLLLSINGQAIADVATFERIMKDVLAKKPKVVQMFVRRGYRTHFVFIEPEWQRLNDAD